MNRSTKPDDGMAASLAASLMTWQEPASNWESLFREWVLSRPNLLRLPAREAAAYAEVHALTAGCTGLIRTLLALPPEQIVLGVWSSETEDHGDTVPYLNFFAADTLLHLGIAADFSNRFESGYCSEADFTHWVIRKLAEHQAAPDDSAAESPQSPCHTPG